MNTLATKIPSDAWINASWDEYLQISENPDYENAKFYYYQEKLRIEMSPLGNDHASDHSIINYGINIFVAVKGIDLNGKDNCSYRKTGYQEAQPDLSYYIGDTVDAVPYGTGVIDLDKYPAPTLVIEIANTSLADDQGSKRLLYEDLGVKEYWIVDVKGLKIIAFKIANQGSSRIRTSQVLPGLEISFLEECLQRSRQNNHGKVGAWLLEQLQK